MSGSTTPPLPLAGGPPPATVPQPSNAPPQTLIPDEAFLITDPSQTPVLTVRGEVDARSAQIRALAQYVRIQSRLVGGHQYKFNRVTHFWAEPEVPSQYPAAVVIPQGPAVYYASRFTPLADSNEILTDAGTGQKVALVTGDEMEADCMVEVWATNIVERTQLCAMLETAFNPVDWRNGFLMEAPYYFGRRISYEKVSVEYIDSDEEAMRRFRRANIILRSRLAVTRTMTFPLARRMAKGEDLRVTVDSGS